MSASTRNTGGPPSYFADLRRRRHMGRRDDAEVRRGTLDGVSIIEFDGATDRADDRLLRPGVPRPGVARAVGRLEDATPRPSRSAGQAYPPAPRPISRRRLPMRTSSHSPAIGSGTKAGSVTRSPLTVTPPPAISRRASPARRPAPASASSGRTRRRAPPASKVNPPVDSKSEREHRRVVDRPRPRTAPRESATARAAAASPWVRAVMSRASARCAGRASGRAASSASSASISLARELGEPAQVGADVAVVGVEPVLVERDTARSAPGRARPSRPSRSCRTSCPTATAAACRRGRGPAARRVLARPRLRPPDQLQAGGDVAPLVGAAHLQLDAHRPVQVAEVVRLEEHVAELGERQAALEPDLDRVLGEHVRHREVLAGVAQEVDQRQLAEPVEVVDHDRAARARA